MRANQDNRPTVVPSSPSSLNLSDPATRLRLTPAAVDGMIRLAALWRLSAEEVCLVLGDMSERSWFRLKKQESLRSALVSGLAPVSGLDPALRPDRALRLSQDMLTRISVMIGIFKGLRLLFSEPLADDWMRLPNRGPLFGGRAPLVVAIERGIPGMLEIRCHVDALRGGL